MTANGVAPERVWYAAYGSNMHLSRLRCYLRGGTPAGGLRAVPGCRDAAEPARSLPMMLPGLLYFATESLVWTGGRAFYDPDGPGETAARAYLLTAAQFSDIAAQEMYRPPGTDLDLTTAIRCGRDPLGPGRYETLSYAGTFEGHPILTCTAPWRHDALPGNAPAPTYLRHLAAGLIEAHGWSVEAAATYLATRPGADLAWTPRSLTDLLRQEV
ncbi:histone deacetylase [Nocardia brasiliensis]|uniref:histone deacetylase n=1 Tax=Nocardia brasiliensis TaxID=37326 RepID=UPI0018949953|nr:histone deacetylase [Nocardia brasiliensis]MBF6547984.1 histone deacetylase [Nocardia brasiliensis]